MKIIILFILSFACQYTYSQFDDQITDKQAMKAAFNINNAAVRIIKDYVYMNMRISYAAKNIDNSFSNSEDALLMLEIYAANHPEIRPNLQKIVSMRKKTRMMFLQKPKKEKIKLDLNKLDKLLQTSGNLINNIKTLEKIQNNQAQESAHNMELLAQQLSFMHALQFMGQNKDEIDGKIKNLEKKFQTNLNILTSHLNSDTAVAFQLKLLQSDWEMYKKIAAKKNQRFINTLYTILDKISNRSGSLAEIR